MHIIHPLRPCSRSRVFTNRSGRWYTVRIWRGNDFILGTRGFSPYRDVHMFIWRPEECGSWVTDVWIKDGKGDTYTHTLTLSHTPTHTHRVDNRTEMAGVCGGWAPDRCMFYLACRVRVGRWYLITRTELMAKNFFFLIFLLFFPRLVFSSRFGLFVFLNGWAARH